MLKAGSLYRLPSYRKDDDGGLYYCQLVTDSRAHLVSVRGRSKHVNVSPNAPLDEVDITTSRGILTSHELTRIIQLEEESIMSDEKAVATETSAAASPIPEGVETKPKGLKAKNEERKARLLQMNTEKKQKREEEKAAKPPRVKAEKKVRPCACGCGGQTTGFFVPGHDARFKGWLLKIERGTMEVKDLPPSVQKSYKWVQKGNGMIPTTNYKGEPHQGYDREE